MLCMKKPAKVTLESLDKKIDTFATLMVEGFETLNGKVDALTEDMTQVKNDVGEIKETMSAHGKAIDKDAVTLVNHETRIKKLEHAR